MAARKRITEQQRATARELFETNETITLREIAEVAGISHQSVSRIARQEGWLRAGRAGRVPAGGTAEGRAALIDALWRAVARRVADLRPPAPDEDGPSERRQGEHRRGGSAGADTSANVLMTIARTVEKLSDLERGERAGAPPAPVDEGPEDIDEFRNEIARRLEGLLAGKQPR